MGLTVTNIQTPNAQLNQFSLGPWNARFVEVAWDSTYLVGGELLTAASLGWNQVFGAIEVQPPVANDGILAEIDLDTAADQLEAFVVDQEAMATALSAGAAGDIAAGVHINDASAHVTLAVAALRRVADHAAREEWVAAATDLTTVHTQLTAAGVDYTAAADDLVDAAAEAHLDDAVVHLGDAVTHISDACTDLTAGAPIAAGTDLIAAAVDLIAFAVDYDNMADDIVQSGATAAGVAAAVHFDQFADDLDLAADHMVAGTLFRTANVTPLGDFTALRFELGTTASVEVTDDTDVSLFKGRYLILGY